MKFRLLLPGALALLCCACVTNIRPNVTYNPPPTERLADFQHFLLEPVTASQQAAQEGYAVRQIGTYMDQRAGVTLSGWENHSRSGRTLVVTPRIEQLKFVGSGARFLVGPLAGSSAVLMRVEFTDAQTGRMIAHPEFYQRAAASGGNWSIGGTDHGMLARIATVVQQYLNRNYVHAVGGPTGLDGTEQQ